MDYPLTYITQNRPFWVSLRCVLIIYFFIIPFPGHPATSAADAYTAYIDRYSDMAVEQQARHGIPASITLAQGLLESAAGRSTLATKGNNHFGIKCHREWTGDTLLRSDDAPNECFRAYSDPLESFEDHSHFLRRQRYASLFELPTDDYVGWAKGLKRCGYATDPNYAQRLITIIERYSLYLFDTEAGRRTEEVAGFIMETLSRTHPIRKTAAGLHYVIALPGDTYGSIAGELSLNTASLLMYNDAPGDGEIKPWEEVYLVEKQNEYTGPEKRATIGQDESLHSVAQRFGIKVSALRALNPGVRDTPGTRIRLKKN